MGPRAASSTTACARRAVAWRRWSAPDCCSTTTLASWWCRWAGTVSSRASLRRSTERSRRPRSRRRPAQRSEEHTSELQSHSDLVCRLLLEKKKKAAVAAKLLGDEALVGGVLADVESSALYEPHFFFFDFVTSEIYTPSLLNALPISAPARA